MIRCAVFFATVGQRIGGLRWSFVAGQTLLLAAIVLFALSRSVALLVTARAIQGFSCGAVFTAGYPLLYDAVGSAHIGRALGYTSMSLSLGFFVGPVAGGFLYDAVGFVWVFAPSAFLTGLEVLLRLLVVEPEPQIGTTQSRNDSLREGNDPRRPLLEGHSGSSAESASAQEVSSAYGTSAGGPVPESATSKAAVRPVRVLLRSPRFLTAMISLFVINNITASFETFIPVFAYEQFGFTSSQTALLFLAITVPMICSPLSGYLSDRFGARGPALSGFMLWCPTMVGMFLMDKPGRQQDVHLGYFIALLTSFGVGSTLTFTPIYSEVSASVEEIKREAPEALGDRGAVILAFGLENGAFGLGAMIGPIYAAVLNRKYGFGGMSAVFGALSLINCLPVALYTGDRYARGTAPRPITEAA